jgi:hypothetical protein
MALSPKLRKLIEQRDEHCYHCGTTEGLQFLITGRIVGWVDLNCLDTPDNSDSGLCSLELLHGV